MIKILFISYGTGGAEAINPIYLAFSNLAIYQVENISISPYTRNRLSNPKEVKYTDIFKYIEVYKPDLVVNERSNGCTEQNNITTFCKKHSILNICVLDTYDNYEVRFTSKPNYVFCPLQQTLQDLIDFGFSQDSLILTGNPAFDNVPRYNKCFYSTNPKILFASQPLKRFNYPVTQYEVFNEFYSQLKQNFQHFTICIRLHPVENFDEWQTFLDTTYPEAYINNEAFFDFNNRLKDFNMVIGYDSTVMMKSYLQGIPTITYETIEQGIKIYLKHKQLTYPRYNFPPNGARNSYNAIRQILKQMEVE